MGYAKQVLAPEKASSGPCPGGSRQAVAALVVALLVACADGPQKLPGAAVDSVLTQSRPQQTEDGSATAADSAPAAGEEGDDEVVAAASWTRGDTQVSGEPPGVAVLREVRTARNEGFDRIVFEFAGEYVPPFAISYVDRPVRSCGSGETVPLPGDAWLEIRLEPAAAHTEEGEPTIEDRQRSPRLPVLLGLTLTCDFEAVVTWVAAVAAPNRYRVLQLSAPPRLVVDLEH